MEANQKKILKTISLEIRHILEGRYENDRLIIGDLERRLNEIGVWRDRPSKPVEELPHLSPQDKEASRVVEAYLKYREEAGIKREDSVAEFVRESAYSWANRLLALRCMESRGIIDEIIVQKEVYSGRSLVHNRFSRKYPEACSGEDDGLFGMLFEEFAAQSKELSDIFNPIAPSVALRPSVAALKRIIDLLSGKIAIQGQEKASDEVFMAQDTLGWAYQYWNAEEKDRVFELVRSKKGAKIEGKDIIPATQLYTEPYMVKFLVQNSLGAMWMKMHPESKLIDKLEYYVKDADRTVLNKKSIKEVTFLDPACGSGHFLVEAFDLFYYMYREECVGMTPGEICKNILNNNIYGIEIDERAAQITKVVLWMKAKETASEFTIKENETFKNHIISTSFRLPKGKDHLDIFLKKHPEDVLFKSAIESVFDGLENVNELGSLVQIKEPVEKELKYISEKAKQRTFEASSGAITALQDFEKMKTDVLSRLLNHFNNEAENPDLVQAFFSDSIGKGLALFDLLDKRYDIIAANPPYMGSKNMSLYLKNYIAKYYSSGKRDLYATFILCNLRLLNDNGLVAMVTQHSWLFIESFKQMREDIIKNYNIINFAHLGPHAFQEISGEVVNAILFVISKKKTLNNYIVSYKLLSSDTAFEKNRLLLNAVKSPIENIVFYPKQNTFLNIPNFMIVYWASNEISGLLSNENKLDTILKVVEPSTTGNNSRYVRYIWEEYNFKRWFLSSKGGGYSKWIGLNSYLIEWEYNGIRIKSYNGSFIRNEDYMFREGLTFSQICSGSLSVRLLPKNSTFGKAGPGIFPKNTSLYYILGLLNTRIITYLLRSTSSSFNFSTGSIPLLPIPYKKINIDHLVNLCLESKLTISSHNLLENNFDYKQFSSYKGNSLKEKFNQYIISMLHLEVYLHIYEGLIEKSAITAYDISSQELGNIINELGKPISWNQLIMGYDKIDDNNSKVDYTDIQYNKYIDLSKNSTIKKDLYSLYSSELEYTKENEDIENDEDDSQNDLVTNYRTIPNETLLEFLSSKLSIHPISTYLLLKEGIEKEGLINKSELEKYTKDFLTTIILCLFGYSWLNHNEVNRINEDIWHDGIIPLTPNTGENSFYDYVKKAISEDLPGGNITLIEREFEEIFNVSLEKWLCKSFINYHISQFKKRPIIWQIQSMPIIKMGESRRGLQSSPAFSCLVYYHKLDADMLPKIRNQYVGPLINRYETELRTIENVYALSGDQSARKVQLENWIEELRDFDTKLALVSVYGFSQLPINEWGKEGKADIETLKLTLSKEPIDNWTSKDGIAPKPANIEELTLQESRYDPDINDGVRVNIAPLQKAGLLAADVLAKKDLDKAIADRAEWRSDERRWCREGKLPRPGWWKEENIQ